MLTHPARGQAGTVGYATLDLDLGGLPASPGAQLLAVVLEADFPGDTDDFVRVSSSLTTTRALSGLVPVSPCSRTHY